MEFLEFLECFYNIGIFRKGFSLLAESGLLLKVLLEVKVTELAVDINEVVELGDIELIGIVHVTEILLGNGTGFPPAVLDVTELGECVLHLSGLIYKGFELLNDCLLYREVLLPLGILLLVIFCTFLLIVHVQ